MFSDSTEFSEEEADPDADADSDDGDGDLWDELAAETVLEEDEERTAMQTVRSLLVHAGAGARFLIRWSGRRLLRVVKAVLRAVRLLPPSTALFFCFFVFLFFIIYYYFFCYLLSLVLCVLCVCCVCVVCVCVCVYLFSFNFFLFFCVCNFFFFWFSSLFLW